MYENYLKILHEEQLEILDEIVHICKKNKLQYYLIGGTLLGAIRHGGFIPWDDDLDIAMPRTDFDKLLNLCSSELSDGYELIWSSTCASYPRLFAKIQKKNTIFYSGVKYTNDEYPAIFIDIFPLDETNGLSKEVYFRKWFVKKLSTMMSMQLNINKVSIIKRFILSIFPTRVLHRITQICMRGITNNTYKYYTNFGSQRDIIRQTILKENYGNGKEVKFENRMYIVPNNYEKVLKTIFGSNYMEIPPKEKQRCHYPTLVKFSDGTEYRFDQPIYKVTIKDE